MSASTSRWVARRAPVLVVLAALVATGCSAPRQAPDPSGTVTVSYDGAVARLAEIGPAEAGQQVQDWARLGLASALGLSGDQLLDQTYDATVLRDDALDGLVDQPVTPGRSVLDPRTDTLHLLVAADDPMPQRTIAGLLDDRRADAGADPATTQVHTFVVDGPGRKVEIEASDPEPTTAARARNGWIESRIDDTASLSGFLDVVDQLTRVELRGSDTWAQGWDLPDVTPSIRPADVAVLARGYASTTGPLPGFSLDPAPRPSPAELPAVLAGVPPAVVRALATGNYAGSGFASADELRQAVQATLYADEPPRGGLPADRTLLWAIDRQLAGDPVYSRARYDGGLAGTEVGMTLFYTDYVAKNWSGGVGTAVPYGRVPGFVPDSRAQTPPGLCPSPDQAAAGRSGRLWFGQNDAAFSYGPDGVSIGRQATRLYSRANGPAGSEVEPDYQFGRGLRWWDRNAEAVADYDPQYRRLEQLMRWSGALDWLGLSGRSLTAGAAPAPNSGFADWYAAHPELRERAPLSLIRLPATTESVRTQPSAAYTDCGSVPEISGGVSLSDLSARGGPPAAAPVPVGLSRARGADPGGTRIDAAGDGTITRRTEQQSATAGTRLVYALRHGDAATGTVTTDRSLAVRAGDTRLVTDGGRTFRQVFRSDGPNYAIDVSSQGVNSGRVSVVADGDAVSVSYLPGVRDLFTRAAERIAASPGPAGGAPFRYSYDVPGGRVSRVSDGTSAGWVATGRPAPSTFRVTATAEARRTDGTLERVVTGDPVTLDAAQLDRVGPESGPARTTAGRLAEDLPPGTPVYTTDPAAFVAGTIPPDLPVVFRTRGPSDSVPPGGVGPGGPSGPGGPVTLDDRFSAGGPSGGSAAGDTGPSGSAGPPGAGGLFGLGGAAGPGYGGGGTIVVVTACPADEQQRRQLEPEQRRECEQ